MEQDNVLPNDGSYFLPREPKEQEVGRQKERAKTLEGQTILKEVVTHLEKRIEFYGSVDSIPNDVKAVPNQFLIMHNANEIVRDNLKSEKEYINSLLDTAGVPTE